MYEDQVRIEPERVEVLEDPETEALRALADLLARILDSAVRIPGTRVRLGLDPVLGLMPGLGDAVASLIGSAILLLAVQLKVPRIVIARMGVHMLLNGAVGAIPVVGDLFSVWFKSNACNAALLRRASRGRRRATLGDWLFVAGVLVGAMAAVVGAMAGIIWLIVRLAEWMQ